MNNMKVDKNMIEEIARRANRTPVTSVVPMASNMNNWQQRNTIAPEEKEITDMPLAEMIAGLREGMKELYPKASVLMMGITPLENGNMNVIYEYAGKEEELWTAMSESMHHSEYAIRLVYKALSMYMSACDNDKAERGVTALQDLIALIRSKNSRETRIKLIDAEIKRLSRQGRFDMVRIKKQEKEELENEIMLEKERADKAEKRRLQRLEALKKAREAKTAKKRKREQLERERNRQQPNFAKMAKKKMQKIAARQAEKRQKSGSANDNETRSCSQLLKAV